MRERAWDLAPVPLEPRIAIVRQAYVALGLRCLCPECLRLDARFPSEGFQLALFPYRRSTGPKK